MTKRLILTSVICLFTMLQMTSAQYQLENAGFEEWKSTSLPVGWNTYETAQGDYADFAKPTCLWLDNLPPLLPEQINLKKYGNFITRMGSHNYKKCITPIEVGSAMVKQWQHLL